MKMKNNLCDGYQYEIQKSRDGGGNNAYKIFITGGGGIHSKHNILCGTVHEYLENKKIISAMDTSMKCKKVRMEE